MLCRLGGRERFTLRSQRVPRLKVLLAVAAAFVLVAATELPASAVGTEHWWAGGKVVQLSDGDTPYVDIAGDGTKTKQPIRLIGIQATETRHQLHGRWTGKTWCHGWAAKNRLNQIEPVGSTVRMRSVLRSSSSGGRRLRTVYAKQHDGSWLNVQRSMIQDGYVLWFAMTPENPHNHDYHVLADRAALAGKNVWDPTYCGYGPQQTAKLQVLVHWDANGYDDQDNAHRNDEYVIVRNNGGAGTVNLGGWYLRESGPQVYKFPAGTTLASGHELRVHTGKGTRTASNLYWGLTHSIFDQVATSTYGKSLGMGDGADLLDPQGDFRAWNTYPCVINCHSPSGANVKISRVVYDYPGGDAGHESVTVTNSGSSAQSLAHLQLRSWPYNYVFPSTYSLGAGRSVVVHLTSSSRHAADTSSNLYWWPGAQAVLNDTTDEVDLSTLTDVLISCKTWNNTRSKSATCNW
jgi:endonuclease YncB( thermonuclease family)